MIRLTARFAQLDDALLTEIAAAREAVAQCEVYRSLAAGEEAYALAMLCDDEKDIAALLERSGQFPALSQIFTDGDVEIYRQSSYQLADGCWTPTDATTEPGPIMWPAAGPVSIVIQGAYQPNELMRELTAREIAETRREPGCIHYAWYENIELPDHLMLLELWSDQRIYDLHWQGRMRSVELRGDSGRQPAPMLRGEPSREFYRQQAFELHYGMFLPREPERYAETVRWGAR
ncbi:putative quinol monooxygenase [Corynebacterium hindlerae]|uniref:putative quinol monooxygenase n=1 Tax=Corynebacterium hindlerae TaxID=699041 RepID=UPI003AB0ED81